MRTIFPAPYVWYSRYTILIVATRCVMAHIYCRALSAHRAMFNIPDPRRESTANERGYKYA